MIMELSGNVFASTHDNALIAKAYNEALNVFEQAGVKNPADSIKEKKNANLIIEESAKLTKTLGKTIIPRRVETDYIIRLQRGLIDNQYYSDLLSVLVHELIHVLYPLDGHKGRFQITARKINAVRPDVHVTAFYKREEHMYQAPQCTEKKRYAIQCPECGATWEFSRMTDKVRYPNRYYCKRCHQDLVRIR